MSITKPLVTVSLGIGLLLAAQLAVAKQYQYKDQDGRIVVSQEQPPAGVSYAVMDDNGVYQYLVPVAPLQPQPQAKQDAEGEERERVREPSLAAAETSG